MMQSFVRDCHRYSSEPDLRGARMLALFLRYPGLQASFVYRLGKASQCNRFGMRRLIGRALYTLLNYLVVKAYDIRLELSADIGPALYIGHMGNICIANCVIGESCSIGQSSHIVGPGHGLRAELGDRVWFGAHARLVGAYKVGSGCTVSAGALINRDLPADALCLGSPVRVVMMGYDNSAFLGLPSKRKAAESA